MTTIEPLLSAVLFTLGAVGIAASSRTPGQASPLLLVAVGGLAFQLFHALEHVLQLGHWLVWPSDGAWLTPWAAAGRDVLGARAGRAVGIELLHLVGNVLFAVGAGAASSLSRRRGPLPTTLRVGLVVQAAHVLEHVALTTTVLLGGRAVGVTNLLGSLPPGSVAVATRVWTHFVVNLVATAAVLVGLRRVLDAPQVGQ